MPAIDSEKSIAPYGEFSFRKKARILFKYKIRSCC